MPCATNSCLWCDFDVVSSGLPPPFLSLRLSPLVASAVLGLRYVCFGFCLLLLPSTDLCFSISSLLQSSLFDPSSCILPADAYWVLSRKVRESDPRVIADLLLSRELPYHSANLPCSVCRNIIAAPTVIPRPCSSPRSNFISPHLQAPKFPLG